MMEALQDLSTRMSAVEDAQEIHVDQVQSHNSAAVSFPFPPSGLPPRPRSFPALAGSGGPGFPSNDGGDGFDDEDEELIRDRMPQSFTSHRDLVERDIVDARSLRYATLGPVPSSASDFRAWKNQLLLIIAKLDISDRDYLAHWLSKAYEVNSDEVIKHDSGCVPRLDRWLAAKVKMCLSCRSRSWGTLKDALELETLPGADTCCIVSRHFDIDRTRGSLLTSQSIFKWGYSAKHLQEFSGRVLRTWNSVPQEDWLSQRIMGEWLFHRLRQDRKLERTIDEIKRSDALSPLRDFDHLWNRLQEHLLEEREDINAQSIENLLGSSLPKKSQPDKPTSAPAAIAPSSESKTSPKCKANDSRAKGQNSVHLL